MAEGTFATVLAELEVAWSTSDIPKLLTLFTDDATHEDVPTGTLSRGKEGIEAFVLMLRTAFPDMKMTLVNRIIGDDWACGEWMMTGTHAGDYPNLPATGKALNVRGVSIYEFQDGKIKREADYWDLLGSGMVPESPQE